MVVARIIILFALAALAEIGGAWLIWQSVRENRGWLFALLGVLALGAYGFVAALQPDANFGRVLAAYGGIFIAGSLAWGIVVDGFRPMMWDYVGSAIALIGAAIIIVAPAGSRAVEE
jgi:small multidrug resistance family-3 protein